MNALLYGLLFCLILSSGSASRGEVLPSISTETSGNMVRFITTPSGPYESHPLQTIRFDNSRSEKLWIDRNHQNRIVQHVAISGNGMYVQAGWYLDTGRASLYRTLGTGVPLWSKSMANTISFVSVASSYTAEDINIASSNEPVSGHSYASVVPKWTFDLPDGFYAFVNLHGPAVVVSDDGAYYAVLARDETQGKVFVFDHSGGMLNSITFPVNNGIDGLDASNDCSVLCVSTFGAIYVFNRDGTRRDSIYNFGEAVAKVSGDGSCLVQGDYASCVRFRRWNGTSYSLVWQHSVSYPMVTALAISDDGSTIMAGTYQYSPSYAGKVVMFDSSSATPLWEYAQYGDWVSSCALSDDGSRGVAGSWGQYNGTYGDVITVFEKSTENPLVQILDDIDEPGSIFSVAMSGDGSFVTAGGKAVHARQLGNGGEVYAIRLLEWLKFDAGVQSIDAPTTFLQTGQNIYPQAIVENYGLYAVTDLVAVCEIYDSYNLLIYADTVSIGTLQPGATAAAAFASSWSVPAYGTYRTRTYTVLEQDDYPPNDTCTRTSICYHDAAAISCVYPFSEITVNYTKPPYVEISNLGSYAEVIPVMCQIYGRGNVSVYTGYGQAYLNPLESATIALSPAWTPSKAIAYRVHTSTELANDYNPLNDTVKTTSKATTEIMYDDGNIDAYIATTTFHDDKYAVKMIPCISPPYYITRARCIVSNSDPVAVSLNRDSLGLPGLNPSYEIASPETISGSAGGWAVREYSPPIYINNEFASPFWMVIHKLSSSPTTPYIGMDNTAPLDAYSYWYWISPSSYGWHSYPSSDYMMRVLISKNVRECADTEGSEANDSRNEQFSVHMPAPNPFTSRVHVGFSVPRAGNVCVKVFDVTGSFVSSIVDQLMDPGEYIYTWSGVDEDGKKLSPGVYFVHTEYEQELVTTKVIYVSE